MIGCSKTYRWSLLLTCLLFTAANAADEKLRVRISTDAPDRYELTEILVAGVGEYDTPYNPAIVTLDAELTAPSGKKLIVPGFAMHRTQLGPGKRYREYAAAGPWLWKVRFAGSEEGTYKGTVAVTTPEGKRTSDEFEFNVAPSKSRGLIRVAKGNPHAFEYENGAPFIAIGNCLCWNNGNDRAALYKSWLDKMAANDCNFIRIWLGSKWCFGLEQNDSGNFTTPYYYNEDAATLMDEVLKMCEERGIAIKLCFGDNVSGYLHHNGGSYQIRSAADFLTDEKARTQWKAMIRYCVARWGYSTNIFAWEQWNEMDDNFWNSGGIKKVEEWTEEMCGYTKSIDPFGHMTTNSTGSGKEQFGLYAKPSVDYAQYHNYGGERLQDKAQYEIYAPAVRNLRRLNKPVLVAECGLVNKQWGPYPATSNGGRRDAAGPKDTKGYAFHEAIWVGFMAGGAGTSQHWWWDSMVDPWNLYPQYKPFANFVAGLDINKAPMPPVEATVTPSNLRVFARSGKPGTIAWVINRSDWWRALVMDGKTPEKVSAATLALPDLEPGRYAIQFMDPWTGAAIEERQLEVPAGQKHTTVNLPDFTIDIAIKAIRQ